MHLAKKIGKILTAIGFGTAIILASQEASAKIEVKAIPSTKAMDPSDTLVLTIAVETDGEEVKVQPPKLPPLSDFDENENGRSQRQEMNASLVQTPTGPQFKTVRRVLFDYQLAPKRLGALTIYPVEVMIDGRSYRTSAVQIQVASGLGKQQGAPPSRARPGQGFEDNDFEDADDLFTQLLKRGMQRHGMPVPGLPGQRGGGGGAGGSRTLPTNPNEAFFIQVEADKTEAYVGEQITVSFFLYTTGVIRDLDTLKYPSLRGFWKEDIEIATHLNFQQEVIDGVPYKKALLASFALFPIKEGSATIDSYQAKCTVIPGNDPFGALGMGKAFTFTKSSTPIKVTVKPLPNEGRPPEFSGAVGDFQVTARIDERNVVANQPFPLKIRFEGRGNAKLVDIPPFQPPEGMELYDTQKEAKFFAWGTSFKEFTLQLIPRREGEFEIPSIAASIFDPQSKRYISRATEPLRIRVGQGAAAQGSSQSFTGAGQPGKPGVAKAKGSGEPTFRTVFKPQTKWTATHAVGLSALLYSIAIAVLLMIASYELGWGKGRPRLNRLVKLRVRDLESRAKAGDVRGVGVRGVNLLAFTLGEIVGERVSDREVMKLLEGMPPSIQKECGAGIADSLQEFELLAFAPESILGDKKEPAKLKALIASVAKTLERTVALSGSGERSGGS